MIISFTGPSGVGKGFLKDHLRAQRADFHELQWITTRQLREGEAERRDRQRVSEDEFAHMRRNGELTLDSQIHMHWYGLRKRDLEDTTRVYLTEFHIDNYLIVRQESFNGIGIALTATPEFLAYRLREIRQSESEAEITVRLRAAIPEMEAIRANLHLFSLCIEVCRENEQTLAQTITAFVQHQLTTRGV